MYEALSFRAELWCAKTGLLVQEVWARAQALPGRTFAAVSRELLVEHGVPEVHGLPGWQEHMEERSPVLPEYKTMLYRELVNHSTCKWKLALRQVANVGTHLLSQRCPVRVGARFMDRECRSLLRAAMDFDLLRIGVFPLSMAVPGSKSRRRCILCASEDHGLAHILAECSASERGRAGLLSSVDQALAQSLLIAPAGDWPTVLLCPHADFNRLKHLVTYAAELAHLLRPL